MSRRNRTNRRRNYGKRQHEVRERHPAGTPSDDLLPRDDGWVAPEGIDESSRRDDAYGASNASNASNGYEGWAR